MKILIVTGKLAETTIKKQVLGLKHQVDVFALPVTVAAFITPKYVKLVPKDSIPIIGRKLNRFYDLRKENPLNNMVRNFMKDFQEVC